MLNRRGTGAETNERLEVLDHLFYCLAVSGHSSRAVLCLDRVEITLEPLVGGDYIDVSIDPVEAFVAIAQLELFLGGGRGDFRCPAVAGKDADIQRAMQLRVVRAFVALFCGDELDGLLRRPVLKVLLLQHRPVGGRQVIDGRVDQNENHRFIFRSDAG